MKVSGKGLIVIILFLVGIPAIVDMILAFVLPKKNPGNFSMALPMLSAYVKLIPFYVIYLIIAFAIIFGIKHRRKITGKK